MNQLLTESLKKQFKGWSDREFLIRSYGVLRNLEKARAGKWNKLFDVSLETDGPLVVSAPRQLLERYNDGDFVEIVGYPAINVYKNSVTVLLEIVDIRRAESAAEQEQRRAVQTGLETLQVLKPRKNPFPIKSQVTINLIFSTASGVSVHEDFYRGLGDQRKYCTVTETRIRVTSADEM